MSHALLPLCAFLQTRLRCFKGGHGRSQGRLRAGCRERAGSLIWGWMLWVCVESRSLFLTLVGHLRLLVRVRRAGQRPSTCLAPSHQAVGTLCILNFPPAAIPDNASRGLQKPGRRVSSRAAPLTQQFLICPELLHSNGFPSRSHL